MNTSNTNKKNERIGETCLQNCGIKAKIIDYSNNRDITIEFPDGRQVKHRTYHQFQKGSINHPDTDAYNKRIRTGQVRMQNCGQKAKIIRYRASNDIDVQFSDERIVRHRNYHEFVHGLIRHPDVKKIMTERADERMYEIKTQNCGLKAQIVAYRGSTDIDVRFQDNTTVKHKAYNQFIKGSIGHPTINKRFHTNVKKIYPRSGSKIYHTQIHGIACVTNDIYYYYCHCPICLAHEIWTFDEIREHKCNHRLVQEREKLIKARSGVPAA